MTGEKPGEAGFFPTLASNFSSLNAWNPPLFIRGGREIFCFYQGPISALDSAQKDLNRWLKVVIMNCQILAIKSYLSWPLWADTMIVVVSINQKEPYRGTVKCQAIMVVYVLSSLVKRRSIKCT
jgi:hypothetical protein